MKLSTLIIISLLTLSSCSKEQTVTQSEDYRSYLSKTSQEQLPSSFNAEYTFWESKLSAQPKNAIYQQKMAAMQATQFKMNYEISALTESHSSLVSLHKRFPKNVGILHQLVSSSITQHAFNDALRYAEKALSLGEKKYISQLLIVDVLLEKGLLVEARQSLESLGDKNIFDEQIRWVKLLDAEGKLDEAVDKMERALANAQASKQESLITWSLSNLGDMYGHQGKIKKSYETYLASLAINPRDYHSLKGIGWIALSNDHLPERAISIWERLRELEANPELDLLLAEAYTVANNEPKAKQHEALFISQVNDTRYGNMYGSYLIRVLPDAKTKSILELAEADLQERKHPMTYGKYAWALHRSGKTKEAKAIIEEFMIGQTEEPDSYYISGVIYDELGITDRASDMLEEALAASYELGPIATAEINMRLKSM